MPRLEEEVEQRVEDLTEDITDIKADVGEVITEIEVDRSDGSRTWGAGDATIDLFNVLSEYEIWYNEAVPLISEYLPDREDEFRERYQTVRKALEMDLEYIKDKEIRKPATLGSKVAHGIMFQSQLLSSIPKRVKSQQLKARESVSSDIVSDEIQKAKEMFDDGNTRAAGVVTGVALERHLLTLCESSEQDLDFDYMDGITSLSQTLSKAGEITDDDDRLLGYLAGIRNKCSHASEEEPEKREVERMIDEANDFLRE